MTKATRSLSNTHSGNDPPQHPPTRHEYHLITHTITPQQHRSPPGSERPKLSGFPTARDVIKVSSPEHEQDSHTQQHAPLNKTHGPNPFILGSKQTATNQ